MYSWCQVCGSADMTTGVDGSFFCQSCGAQNENYIEEAFDNDGAHLFSSRFVRETRATATQNETQAATQRSEIPLEILAGSQAFISQPAPGENGEASPGGVFGTTYATGSGGGPSETAQLLGSKFGLSQKSKKQPPIDKEELSNSIRKSYVEGIQKILFMQCETLVDDFDVTPLICGIIGPLWLRYLASTRVFEKAWADEALEVAEERERRRKNSRRLVFKEHGADLGPDVPEEPVMSSGALAGPKGPRMRRPRRRKGVVEPRTTFGRKARYVWLSALKERLPLSITLALSYLACYIGRETVLPTDVRRWALKGKLPFLAAYIELSKPSPEHIPNTIGGLQMFPINAKVMFKPRNVVGARVVELLAGHIAERIGLELPPVNYHALSGRLLHAMKLPVEKLLVYTHRIYEWHCPSGLWLTSKEAALPTRVYVMAMIVIVLKVLYGLDGRIDNQASGKEAATSVTAVRTPFDNKESNGADEEAPEDMQVESEEPNKSDVDVTSQKQNRDADVEDPEVPDDVVNSQKAHKMEELWDVKELLKHMKKMKPFRIESSTMLDHERKLAAYLKYCHDVIYPGPASDADEDNMREYFWKIYEKKADEATQNKQRAESDDDVEGAVNRGEEEEPGHVVHTGDTGGRNENARFSTRAHGSVGSVAGVRNNVQSRKTSNDRLITLDCSGRKPRKNVQEGQDVAMEANTRNDSELEDFDPTAEDARYEEKETKRLMKEMKKLGFCCLRPLTRNEVPENVYVGYRYYASYRDLTPVHQDYFVILRVCAKLIKVHPKALHCGVQKVEQGLMEIEKNTRDFILSQEGDIAKLYKENFGERIVYRVRDRAEEFKKKKQKLMMARYRVDEGFGSEKDYTDLILHADYL